MHRRDVGTAGRGGERRGRAWLWRALPLLLLLVLAGLCGGSAPVRTPSLDLVSATDPVPPGSVTLAPADRALGVSWTAAAEITVSGYRVRTYLGAVLVSDTTTTGLSTTVTGLSNGQSYRVTVTTLSTFLGAEYEGSEAREATGVPRDTTAPAPPTGVAAAGGDGRVTVTWTAGPEYDVDAYEVLRDGAPVSGPLAGRATTSWEDTGVVNGTTYAYAVRARDTSGNWSAASTPPATARPADTTPPAAPTGLAAVPGDGRVDLTWTAGAEADLASHELRRDGALLAVLPATATSYADPGLVNGRSYAYELVAVDTAGNRSPAAAVAATPRDTTAPAAPTWFAAMPGSRWVELSWTAGTEADLAGYELRRDGQLVATTTATAVTDTGLVDGTTYRYELVAVDTSGNRSPVASLSATPTDTTGPAAPVGFTGTRGDGRVDLSWAAGTEPDLDSYELRRDGALLAALPATATAYADPGLVNGRTYAYELVAVDTAGNRSPASVVMATPRDTTPPGAPADLAAAPAAGRVDLTWTAGAEADLDSYELRRDGALLAALPATATSYADTGLVDGTTYGYELVAVDTAGNRSAAAAVSGAPRDATPPAAPAGVTATAGDRSAVVRWPAPPEADVVEHRVLHQDGRVAAVVAAPGTEATVTGLVNGTTYRLTVVAVDAAGNVSPVSAEVAVTPAPPPAPPVPAEGAGQEGGAAASADGRFVVVGTRARLEPGDTNTAYELHLLDRTAGTATRIAPLPASASGATDPTNTAAPAVSDDGRYVALATRAKLAADDLNGTDDVYRYDTVARTWALASVPRGGTVSYRTPGTLLQTGSSVHAKSPPVAISGDGDLVLFYSARDDLVAGDRNGAVDLFATRMSTGVVTRVSATAAGGDLPHAALGPALALTPDGRYALFPAARSGAAPVLYRKSLSGPDLGEARVVSAVTAGGRTTEFDVFRDTGDIALSDDGRYVALVTAAKIDTATPSQRWSTGFAHRVDTQTGAVVALGNGQRTRWEHRVELDPTGRWAFFATDAGELPGDTNGRSDFYRRDLSGGTPGPLVLVTADADGRATGGPTGTVQPSEYGRLLALTGDSVLVTTSQALLPTDTNGVRDLYTKDLATGAVGFPR